MLPQSVRIFVCTTPQDMRRSFDTLAVITKHELGIDPQSGSLIAFTNKRANRIKILWWDQNGYCVLYKRLHGALFQPPKSDGAEQKIKINGSELTKLLRGVDRPRRVSRRQRIA